MKNAIATVTSNGVGRTVYKARVVALRVFFRNWLPGTESTQTIRVFHVLADPGTCYTSSLFGFMCTYIFSWQHCTLPLPFDAIYGDLYVYTLSHLLAVLEYTLYRGFYNRCLLTRIHSWPLEWVESSRWCWKIFPSRKNIGILNSISIKQV